MSYQKLIIQGNLGKDPEVRYSQQGGKAVCKFSVAVSDKGPKGEHTEWFNAVCFDKTAEIAGQYLKKGSPVLLDGKLKTEEYEKDGEKKRFTSFLVDRVTLLGGKQDGGPRDLPSRDAPSPGKPMATRPVVEEDDGLPF